MSLLSELKRRKVFRVSASCMVLAWLLIEVSDMVWHQRGAAPLARAMAYFEEAIGRDPAFAPAHAARGLGEAHASLVRRIGLARP